MEEGNIFFQKRRCQFENFFLPTLLEKYYGGRQGWVSNSKTNRKVISVRSEWEGKSFYLMSCPQYHHCESTGSPIMLGANHLPQEVQTTNSSTNAIVVDSSRSSNSSSNVTSDMSAEEFVCALYNPDFIILSSLGSFYIPCFVMVILYARIFRVMSKRTIMFQEKEVLTTSYSSFP